MSVSILVVDDEPDVAELFRQRFRREARQGTYVMHFAASGEDALAKLALLREIKERWAELPVMMVTAYGDDERRRRAGEHGAAEFITKPVDFEMLKERLRQLPSASD